MASVTKAFWLPPPLSLLLKEVGFRQWCKDKFNIIVMTKIYSSWIIQYTACFGNESSQFHVSGINFEYRDGNVQHITALYQRMLFLSTRKK